jgi:hypothetical protein
LYNVGGVLEPYDSDRSFPVYGFGGVPKHMNENQVNHCFPINGNIMQPELVGIESIV